MAAAMVNQVYMVTLNSILHNQTVMNTFYYDCQQVPAGGQTIEQAYVDLFTKINATGKLIDKYRAAVPANMTIVDAWIQCIMPLRYRRTSFLVGAPGGLAGAATTTNVMVSITRTGELASRNMVGGVRIPLSPLNVAVGLVAGPAPAALDALAIEMKAQYGDVGEFLWRPGFISKVLTPPTHTKVFTPTFQTIVQMTARTMRRRTVGLGI